MTQPSRACLPCEGKGFLSKCPCPEPKYNGHVTATGTWCEGGTRCEACDGTGRAPRPAEETPSAEQRLTEP